MQLGVLNVGEIGGFSGCSQLKLNSTIPKSWKESLLISATNIPIFDEADVASTQRGRNYPKKSP